MIQDDPINTAKPIYADHVGYFPLNLNSVEEIVVQDIEVSELITQKSSLLDKENTDDSKIYFKYAMLIGLCKTNINVDILIVYVLCFIY